MVKIGPFVLLFLLIQSVAAESQTHELDEFWAVVAKSVKEGDFERYAATCHPQGVLVSEAKQSSVTLDKALARWKQGFTDTKRGKMKAEVEFRFSQRIGDENTAHETGIFRYATINDAGEESVARIHFAALLVKTEDRWQVLMEHQKTKATVEEWTSLQPSADGAGSE